METNYFSCTQQANYSSAATIQDLVVQTEERKILWHSLREKASQFQEYRQAELPELAIEPEILMMLGDLRLLGDQQDWYQPFSGMMHLIYTFKLNWRFL